MQQSRRPWTKDVTFSVCKQDQAVVQIVEQVGLKNWPLVSTLMRQKYNVMGRSGKQCRQRQLVNQYRWHNQLNPQVNKKPWTQQEEKLLFNAHKTYRNRWIDISKLFEGRTDNSIKNHFYSTIRRSLRRICKLLGNKNSTSQLRNIKPSILSKIFEYSELKGDQVTLENQHMVNESKVITEELLNFARLKPAKANEHVEDPKRKNLQSLIDKLNEFSKNYKSQKDSYRLNIAPCTAVKIPKVIIVKQQTQNKRLQNAKDTGTKPIGQGISISNKKPKTYLYDWDEFEKRCLFVKQVFENQTESKSMDSPYSKPEDYESPILSLNNSFSLEEKSCSEKAETYTTPRNAMRNKGFQPYKDSSRTAIKNDDYKGLVEKLKHEIPLV